MADPAGRNVPAARYAGRAAAGVAAAWLSRTAGPASPLSGRSAEHFSRGWPAAERPTTWR